LRLTLDW